LAKVETFSAAEGQRRPERARRELIPRIPLIFELAISVATLRSGAPFQSRRISHQG
jgi:hypothetical protein